MKKIFILTLLLIITSITYVYSEDYSFVKSGAEFNITDNTDNPVKLYAALKKDEKVVCYNLNNKEITLACNINGIYGVDLIRFTVPEDNLYLLSCSRIYGDITITKTVIVGCFSEDEFNLLLNK